MLRQNLMRCNRLLASSSSHLPSKKTRAIVVDPVAKDTLIQHDVPLPTVKEKPSSVIRVHSAGVNRADILQRAGKYPPPPAAFSQLLGLEVAGHIDSIHVGDMNPFQLKTGDPVMALLDSGGYAEHVLAHLGHIVPIPKFCVPAKEQPALASFASSERDLLLGAATMEAFTTSYQLLIKLAQLQPGQSVIIYAAGSSIGVTAIQIAKHVCQASTIIAVAGSNHKLDFATKLGATHTINYKNPDFPTNIVDLVNHATNTQGINVILDPVCSSMYRTNSNIAALDCKWILFGTLGGHKLANESLAPLLSKRVQLIASTLRNQSVEYKTQLIRDMITTLEPHFEQGTIIPILDSVFSMDQADQAHQRMRSDENLGKIVLKWN